MNGLNTRLRKRIRVFALFDPLTANGRVSEQSKAVGSMLYRNERSTYREITEYTGAERNPQDPREARSVVSDSAIFLVLFTF